MSLSSAFHMTSVCQIPQVAQTKKHFTYLKYIMVVKICYGCDALQCLSINLAYNFIQITIKSCHCCPADFTGRYIKANPQIWFCLSRRLSKITGVLPQTKETRLLLSREGLYKSGFSLPLKKYP